MTRRDSTLRRPMPLKPKGFRDLVEKLTLREVGALVLVALDWWPDGVVRDEHHLSRRLGVPYRRARLILPIILPFLAPGSALAIDRQAHLMKAGRRAKIVREANRRRWNRVRQEAGGGGSEAEN